MSRNNNKIMHNGTTNKDDNDETSKITGVKSIKGINSKACLSETTMKNETSFTQQKEILSRHII